MLYDDTLEDILFRAEEGFRFALLHGYCPADLLKGELILKDTIGSLTVDLLEAAMLDEDGSALTAIRTLLRHRHEVIRGVVYRAVLDRMLDIRYGTFSGACTALLNALSQAEKRPENASFASCWTATSMLYPKFW